MDKDYINYGELIDDAMHIIVKKALEVARDREKLGDHHFFISFLTKHKGVSLSDKLRRKYPHEMTIVLQYQYEDLTVNENEFSVVLSFDNVKERILVPFSALTAFADPSVKFGLQFRHIESDLEDHNSQSSYEKPEGNKGFGTSKTHKDTNKESDKDFNKSNVIKLDAFRNKDKKD